VWGACEGAVGPVDEICNGLDDDCDDTTDEGCPCADGESRSCGSSEGRCELGTQVCAGGAWGACDGGVGPVEEACNDVDDDCDTATDDGLTRPCSTTCGSGTETCSAGVWGGCTAPVPGTEVCDGLDNDCDTTTDEGCGCVPPATRACGTDVGECVAGTQSCEAGGAWGACTGSVEPVAESCDNRDNDCDTATDDGLTRPCSTTCGSGTETCSAGAWGGCTAPAPGSETCNNVDDDCDTATDEGLTRSCSWACGSGTETCSAGVWSGCPTVTAVPPEGGTFPGTTAGTGSLAGTCGGGGASAPEKVYSWTPSQSGVAVIATCGSTLDTVLYLRRTTCTGTQVDCVDQGCASGTGSRLEVVVTGGTTYYIVVDGYSGSGPYTLTVTPPRTGGSFGFWQPTTTAGAPSARMRHTAVWTGSEMIVWGGFDGSFDLNTGARYNPATNTWATVNTTGAPGARSGHSAVWTGTEMIVWGGSDGSGVLANGGRYDPTSNSWTAIPTTGALEARQYHTAVWTGTRMVVWGGSGWTSGTYFNTGAVYNPSSGTWTSMTTTDAPTGRQDHTAVWDGTRMIVWGGQRSATYYGTGGRYLPGSTWSSTATSGAPSPRFNHTAVWTGSQMIVWGGRDSDRKGDGFFYDPASGTGGAWSAMTSTNPPLARDGHTAVWTGSVMIVWGGVDNWVTPLATGGCYSTGSGTWTDTATVDVPAARRLHTAVWTGSVMIVWGGSDETRALNTGGRYTPPP